MNIYRHQFVVRCPANDRRIRYALTIQTSRLIMAEDIVAFCATLRRGFHEDVADRLFGKFGGRQVLVAQHHGVEIETIRCAL